MKLKIITPDQSSYQHWNNRGVNLRFEGKPLEIIPVLSEGELISALQYAVDQHYRLAVRCGGHCLENFVSNPDIDILIDISGMKGVRFDADRNAIEVKAGTTLGELNEMLYKEWGGIKTSSMFATLHLWNKVLGKIQLKGLLTAPTEGVVEEFIYFINRDLGVASSITRTKMTWLDFALNPFPDVFSGPKAAFKVKDAFLCEPFSPRQIGTIYHYLTAYDDVPGGNVGLGTYGGQVNALAGDATASAQRKAIMNTACVVGWLREEDREKSMEWVRKCYADLYEGTGGVPVPGKQSGGCIIAHPDNDMADPSWNKSGLPWSAFYYQDNYPRLQRIKARWDPCHIFKHALSVEPML